MATKSKQSLLKEIKHLLEYLLRKTVAKAEAPIFWLLDAKC